jgi:hypothetical protein
MTNGGCPPRIATRCESGITLNDKLYIGGLFASTLDGGPENVDHFKLAVAMINNKNDGCGLAIELGCR